MTRRRWGSTVAVLIGLAHGSVAAASSVAVMPLVPQRIAAEITTVLDELLVTEVYERSGYKVIGASDINAILGLDKMKSALGCDEVSCAAEIGGALGVDLMVSGAVSRLGEELIITLKLIDIQKTEVKNRLSLRIPDNESRYAAGVAEAVVRLFGLTTAAAEAPAELEPAATAAVEPPPAHLQPPGQAAEPEAASEAASRLANAISVGFGFYQYALTAENVEFFSTTGAQSVELLETKDTIFGAMLEYKRRHGRYFATKLRTILGPRTVRVTEPDVPEYSVDLRLDGDMANSDSYSTAFGAVMGLWEELTWPIWEGSGQLLGADRLFEAYATVGVDFLPPHQEIDNELFVGLGFGAGVRFYWFFLQAALAVPVNGDSQFEFCLAEGVGCATGSSRMFQLDAGLALTTQVGASFNF